MTLSAGFHFLEDSDTSPPLPSATFLDVAGLAAGMRSPMRLERPYFKGQPAVDEIAAKVDAAHARGNKVVLANEMNNRIEQWPGGPGDYRAWFQTVKARVPAARLYWAAPSPAFPGWLDWYDRAEIADGLTVHAYGTLSQMQGVTAMVLNRCPGKPIWVSECNFGAGQQADRNAWAYQHFKPFLDWCSQHPTIEAVSYFAFAWPTPDMSTPTPVDGRGTAIETVLREWRAPAQTPATGGSMQAEYQRAQWLASPNFDARPAGVKPVGIVVHATTGGLQASLDWLRNPTSKVSAHYVVAKDGTIYQLVREASRAWHAGASSYNGRADWNDSSIGVEVVNQNDGRDPYPAAQVASLVALLSYLAGKYNIRPEWIVSHAAIATPRGRKTDPMGLDVPALARKATIDEFAQALLEEGQRQQEIRLNPTAALQRAIYRDGMTPTSDEFPFVWQGLQYVAQRAESLADGRVSIYYARIGDYANVRRVDRAA